MKIFDILIILLLAGFLTSLIIGYFIMLRYKRTIHEKNIEIDTLKRMLATIANTVAEFERQQIASSLHDGVGTMLSVVRLNLERIIRNQSDAKLNAGLLQENKDLLNESCEAIREISRSNMPPALIKLGYENGIKEFCRQINISGGITTVVHVHSTGMKLNSLIELNLFYITQEVINNIVKHSNATKIEVTINFDDKGIETIFTHNGKGINSEAIQELAASGKGVGLKSIFSRIEQICGSINYFSDHAESAKTIIFVPVYA